MINKNIPPKGMVFRILLLFLLKIVCGCNLRFVTSMYMEAYMKEIS